MLYPSLLFKNQPTDFALDYSVFEDLKLTGLISEYVLNAIRKPCPSDDIILRQDLFKALDKPSVTAHFKTLKADVEYLKVLNSGYESARTEAEKYTVFAFLMRQFWTFHTNAASGISTESDLYTAFTSYFADLLIRPTYAALSREIDGIMENIEKIKINTFKIFGETLKISSSKHETYIDKLAKCAEELGLEDIKQKSSSVGGRLNPPLSKRIAPNIISSALKLYPDEMNVLKAFYDKYKNLYIRDILNYNDELGFYLEFKGLADKIRANNIPLCYPSVAEERKISVTDAYDITLFAKNETRIVPNDIYFDENEPFFFLTGANGGGKTTYLRAVGVIVLMFLNGTPIPCRSAVIYPFRKIFTHFPREERFENIGMGRFGEEQSRVRKITAALDVNSLVLLNETYSATSEDIATKSTAELAETIRGTDAFGVYITHQHSVTNGGIPFLNVVVDTNDSNRRTYKVERKRSESGSFAADILKKYSLTKENLYHRFVSPKV
jgi:DNA mismatch repair ATPase MutS